MRLSGVYLGIYVEGAVAQVTLYLDEETKQRVHQAAKAAGLSQSRWLADLVRRSAAEEWPAAVRELAGAWPDFPEATEIRRDSGHDVRRQRL
jgi:hypothetical protein